MFLRRWFVAVVCFFSMGVMEGLAYEDVIKRLKETYWPSSKACWMMWPFVMVRSLIMSFFAFFLFPFIHSLVANLFIYLLVKSPLTHSLTHSLTLSLTHSLTHSLTCSLTHSLTHSTALHSLTHSPTHLLTHKPIISLALNQSSTTLHPSTHS